MAFRLNLSTHATVSPSVARPALTIRSHLCRAQPNRETLRHWQRRPASENLEVRADHFCSHPRQTLPAYTRPFVHLRLHFDTNRFLFEAVMPIHSIGLLPYPTPLLSFKPSPRLP